MTSELDWAIRFMESGRTFGDKIKILMLFVLNFVRNRSPMKIREYFDLMVKGLVLETDIKFVLGTLFDFFVMSAVWELELKEAFDFKEGMVFLDVGAHVGRYSIRAGKKLGKSGKVVAIEPSQTNYEVLCKNISLNTPK